MQELIHRISSWAIENPKLWFIPPIIVAVIAFFPSLIKKVIENRRRTKEEKVIIWAIISFLKTKEKEEDMMTSVKLMIAILTEISYEERSEILNSLDENESTEKAGEHLLREICSVFERPVDGRVGYFRVNPKYRPTYERISNYVEK